MEWLALLTAFFYTGLVHANAPGARGPIKALELNFNSEEVPNDPHNVVRDLRFNAAIDWVGKNDPDIIFLEEAWSYRKDPTVALTLARAIGYDVAYRLEMGAPGLFYEADAVLAKKDFHMTGQKNIKLPHSAFELGDGKTWVANFGGVSYAVGVKLTLNDGEPLYVYATHLVAVKATDRGDQASAIDQDARARAKADGVDWNQAHVIVAGDFNSTSLDPAILLMKKVGYEDSFDAAHPGDTSCSDCADTTYPWFNPFTIAAGLFPSQVDESTSFRNDYIFSHSPSFKALASTLVFTTPYDGVWMSDHYGLMTVFGDESLPKPPNPVHDTEGTVPDTRIVKVSTDQFLCSDPWNNAGNPEGAACANEIAPVVVNGPRGVTIENRSDFYFEIEIDGPGVILATRTAALNPGEQVAFTFNTPGEFTYSIRNTVESPDPYRARISGTVQVQETGY